MTNHETLAWDETGTPIATRFDDPYYSKRDGAAEARHVFLDGNQLPARFATISAESGGGFTIAELGFGTGLNFAEVLALWDEAEVKPVKLTYISYEQYPLTEEEQRRALAVWPHHLARMNEVLERLPKISGWHEIPLGDVTLLLAIGDANHMIETQPIKADAWFLDGFSPAKNPELWNAELMHRVFQQTAANGTFATYTAAGWVRRQLQDAGFEVERVPGFATKRHMSVGVKPTA